MLLESITGMAVRLKNENLELLLKDKKTIELIILMSCHSQHVAKKLILLKLANHVVFVTGNAKLSNKAAEIFSYLFYLQLFSGHKTIC